MAKKIKVDADTFLSSPTQYGVQLQSTEYTYTIGAQVVLFDGTEEYYGKVHSITETSVFCTMGDDTPIEYPKGRIIPTDQPQNKFIIKHQNYVKRISRNRVDVFNTNYGSNYRKSCCHSSKGHGCTENQHSY